MIWLGISALALGAGLWLGQRRLGKRISYCEALCKSLCDASEEQRKELGRLGRRVLMLDADMRQGRQKSESCAKGITRRIDGLEKVIELHHGEIPRRRPSAGPKSK